MIIKWQCAVINDDYNSLIVDDGRRVDDCIGVLVDDCGGDWWMIEWPKKCLLWTHFGTMLRIATYFCTYHDSALQGFIQMHDNCPSTLGGSDLVTLGQFLILLAIQTWH